MPLVCALVVAGCGRVEGDPAAVVGHLRELVEAGDVAALTRYTPEAARHDPALSRHREQMLAEVVAHYAGARSFEPVTSRIDQPFAIVVCREYLHGEDGLSVFFPLHLVRERDGWKVLSRMLQYGRRDIFTDEVARDPAAWFRLERWYADHRGTALRGEVSLDP